MQDTPGRVGALSRAQLNITNKQPQEEISQKGAPSLVRVLARVFCYTLRTRC